MGKEKKDKNVLIEKGTSTMREFKEFISRGNIVDMAVGVIIGGAFGKIVTSLVNDIFMPLIGLVLGGLDFTSLSWKVKETSINYGMFIQNVVDFLIVALCVFLMIKFISKFKRKKEEEKVEEVVKEDEQVVLLREIRDLLKK